MKLLKSKPWAGKKAACHNCGKEYELQKSDKPTRNGDEWIIYPCPSCQIGIVICPTTKPQPSKSLS